MRLFYFVNDRDLHSEDRSLTSTWAYGSGDIFLPNPNHLGAGFEGSVNITFLFI